MLTKEEFEERKKYIGASEAAAVLGLSRWSTPLEVWARKVGEIPYEEEETLPQKVGTKSEQMVAELFMEETGKKVRRVNETVFHKKYPFLGCNLDRKIEGEDAILECKTASVYKIKEWDDDEIPQEYLIQVYHQLACTGYKKGYLACLLGNTKFIIREIEYDASIIGGIVKKEVYFWREFVEKKVMPGQISYKDSDLLYRLFPVVEPESFIELPDEVNIACENLEAMQSDFMSLKAKIEKAKNELKAMLKENEAGSTGIWQVTWKPQHKDAYQVKAWDGRVLRYKKIKEADD
jgi:putative phage-type endonuclease